MIAFSCPIWDLTELTCRYVWETCKDSTMLMVWWCFHCWNTNPPLCQGRTTCQCLLYWAWLHWLTTLVVDMLQIRTKYDKHWQLWWSVWLNSMYTVMLTLSGNCQRSILINYIYQVDDPNSGTLHTAFIYRPAGIVKSVNIIHIYSNCRRVLTWT